MSAPHEPGEFAEGEEAPPPGVRVMAVVRWLLVLAMAGVAGLSLARHYGLWAAGQGEHATLYTCPMHPTVVTDLPGQCPICDMSLVPVEEARKAQAPDHAAHAAGPGTYYCPMHPEVTSEDPEARCAACGGMKLVPRPRANDVAQVTLEGERAQRMGLHTRAVTRSTQPRSLRVWGVIKPSDARVSRVHARAAGYVEQLLVKERAAQVKAGQPLLLFFSPELVAAQRELLTTERFRGQADGPMDDLGGPARDRLRTLGVSEADLEAIVASQSARQTLAIRAPQAGFVSQKDVVQGSYVEAGQLLMEITDLSEVWLIAEVPESALPDLTVGAAAKVHVSGERSERTGELGFIYPELDVGQRTAEVRIRLANRDLTLRPGTSAEVSFDLPAREGLYVPHDAVLDAGEHEYLFVRRGDSTYVQVAVRLGQRAGELVEVLEGLHEGDQVVTGAAFLLDSETRLRSAARPPEAPAAQPESER